MASVRSAAIIILLIASSALADTTWVAGGGVSGVWDVAGSPYIIQSTIVIAPSESLLVRPGVEIRFATHCELDVFGTLDAAGTADSMISFSSVLTNAEGWHGILFSYTDVYTDIHSRMDFCLVKQGVPSPLQTSGAITCSGSTVYLTDCAIRDFQSYGVAGIAADNSSEVILERCEISGIGTGGGCGGAIRVTTATVIANACTIFSNVGLDGGAICARIGATLIMTDCVVHDNRAGIWGGGMFADESEVSLSHCIFYGNHSLTGGAMQVAGSTVNATQCTFVSNRASGYASFFQGGTGTVFNSCIIAGHDSLPAFSGSMLPALQYCCLYNNVGSPQGDEGCFFADPRFADVNHHDYHLQETSPCIDTGDPELPLDPDSTRADVGAYYFPHPVATEPIVGELASEFRLGPVYPNPFNAVTNLEFEMPAAGHVTLSIYDLTGRRMETLVDEIVAPGLHRIQWNADIAPTGVYFAVMRANHQRAVRKLMLLR